MVIETDREGTMDTTMNATRTTCGSEDRRGRVCRLGVGHTAAHRFGDRRLLPQQVEALQSLTAPREYFGASPTLRSLVVLGLAQRRAIGMRWWRYALTTAGAAALQEETTR